jgi:tetratricopeptide (TPR) repeat protein
VSIYTTAIAVSIRNITLFLIVSLIMVALIYNNSCFSSFNIHYQTALAIPNLQANNNTNISSSASDDISTDVVPTVNHPPVANAGINQTVNENTTVTLNGIASDPNNDKLTYSWTQIAGPAIILNNSNTTNPSFTTPSISSDTAIKLSLTAKDDKGAPSSPALVTVTVKAVNQPPLANAGPDQMVNPGHVISLDGTKSNDPDNDPLIYSWLQFEGPIVKLNGADSSMATLTAPSANNISADTDLIFKLTVTDSKNATSTDNVKITVKYIPLPNNRPVANAGVDQTVNVGDTISLDGTASEDQDGNITSYSWKQTAGPSIILNNANTAKPSFTAPGVSSDTQFKFSLTVKDDKGDSSIPHDTTITVKYINQPPIASTTTTDQTVNAGDIVSLDASNTKDPDRSDSLTYSWKQTAGPSVEINDANAPIATFTAPSNLLSDVVLRFQLTVSDSKNATDTAEVNVNVKHIPPPNNAPVAKAGKDITIKEGAFVYLDASNSQDPDGDTLGYSWRQIGGQAVTLNNANTVKATFTAPSGITSDIILEFELIVKDNKSASSTDSVKVTVKHSPPLNKAPVANAGPDQTVNAGNKVTLDGSASTDPDGDPLTYSWEQTGRVQVTLDNANVADPSFTAPTVSSSDIQLKFSLTVKDDTGAISNPAKVTIIVKPVLNPTPETTITPSQIVDYNIKGTALYNQGTYDEAITYFDKVLAIDPNNILALYNKALALKKLGTYDEAITYFDKVVAIDPNNINASIGKGNTLYSLGRYDEAIESYDEALSINPNDDLAKENRDLALKELGNDNEIPPSQNDTSDLQDTDALNKKGEDLHRLGRYQEAIEYYDRALEIEPNDALVWYNKGTTLGSLEKYDESIENFDRALAIDPNYVSALYNKGIALLHLGRYEEALEYHDRALAIDPNHVKALISNGLALRNLERYNEAIEYYDKALAIDPNNVNALGGKGLALLSLERYNEAIEYFDKALAIDPNDDVARNNKADALEKLEEDT